MKPIRIAIVDDGRSSRVVAPFLPANYWVLGRTADVQGTVIAGRDDGPATLERIMLLLAAEDITAREQHMIAPTPEQVLRAKLEALEDEASELIQLAQDEAEAATTRNIVFPEDAAPELDDARESIRDAINKLGGDQL